MSKRFCVNGHDTKKVGRDSGRHCRECERERDRQRATTPTRRAYKSVQLAARKRAKAKLIRGSLRIFKLARGCLLCGSRKDLVLHHRDPASKDFGLGSKARTWAALKREVVKCDVLCSDCHNLITSKLRGEALALSALWIPD